MEHLRFAAGRGLAGSPTRIETQDVDARLRRAVASIGEAQEVLWADRRHALLAVFQGMDCAGKDSTIKHVLSGVNPQGVHVANFREPTANELAHSYLWRYWRQLPQRGQIGVFNRSHYEEVVVMRVHPEYLAERNMPLPETIDEAFWSQRLADLASLEQHLSRSGIRIVKFLLHLSRNEQKARLLARIDRPDKRWKFDPRDVDERALWDDYQRAYEAALAATDTDDCPWYVIPADDKPTMRALVAETIAATLADMQIAIPELPADALERLAEARARLVAE